MNISELKCRLIHDGAASSYTEVEVPCNAFCKPPIHCDLYYNQELTPNLLLITQDVGWYIDKPVEIVRFERAMEAGPIPEYFIAIGTRQEDKEIYAWLVFWKIKE